MKAIVYEKYGPPDVLQIKEVEKPVPAEHHVLVKVHASSVNYGNLVLLKGKPFAARAAFGFFRPKYRIPGGDIAGRVEAAGKGVTQFQPGDEVFGDLSGSGWGGFAEYVCVPEGALVPKPANLTFEEAAAMPMAGVTALQGLRDRGRLRPGQKVLINGASGGVGTFAVQIARALGAEVTGVCSTGNIEVLRSLGADHAIDYKKEDFTRTDERYDLIAGVNGGQPLSVYRRLLRSPGTFVHIGGPGKQLAETMLLGPWMSAAGKKKMRSLLQRANREDLLFLKELAEAGKLKPVLDKQFTLDSVPEAFAYFDQGHARGKVVITM